MDAWAPPHTATATGRTKLNILMLDVAYHTNAGFALKAELAHLTTGHPHHGVAVFFSHELSFSTSTTHHLSTLTVVDLNSVYLATNRDVSQWHAVARLNWRISTSLKHLTLGHLSISQDVVVETMLILHAGNAGTAVWIVLNLLHRQRQASSQAMVKQAVVPLDATTTVPDGDFTSVVAASLLLTSLNEALERLARRYIAQILRCHAAAGGSGWVVLLNRHYLSSFCSVCGCCSSVSNTLISPSLKRTYAFLLSWRCVVPG